MILEKTHTQAGKDNAKLATHNISKWYKELYRKNWVTIVNGRAVACYETGTTAVPLYEAGEYYGDNTGLNTCLRTGEKYQGT
jgi:hypothetical protein